MDFGIWSLDGFWELEFGGILGFGIWVDFGIWGCLEWGRGSNPKPSVENPRVLGLGDLGSMENPQVQAGEREPPGMERKGKGTFQPRQSPIPGIFHPKNLRNFQQNFSPALQDLKN